jgi:hypothetical protein
VGGKVLGANQRLVAMPSDYDKSNGEGVSRPGLLPVLLIIAIIGVLWLSAYFSFD